MKKRNLNPFFKKRGTERVDELMSLPHARSTYLPKGVTIENVSTAFVKAFRKGGQFEFIAKSTNEIVEAISSENERFADLSKTYEKRDDEGVLTTPILVISRSDAVKNSQTPQSRYIEAGRNNFTILEVPYFDGVDKNLELYRVPLPVAVDITFDVKLTSPYLKDHDALSELITRKFSSINTYIEVNGYPVRLLLNNVSKNEELYSKDKKQIRETIYQITSTAKLRNVDEYENITGIKQIRHPLIPPSLADFFKND